MGELINHSPNKNRKRAPFSQLPVGSTLVLLFRNDHYYGELVLFAEKTRTMERLNHFDEGRVDNLRRMHSLHLFMFPYRILDHFDP